MTIEIRRSQLEDATSFSEAVADVAAEKWYLATVDGFSIEQTKAYIEKAVAGSIYQVVAADGARVIGACDVSPRGSKGFAHVGQLGMYVRREWRRQGIGKKSLLACLSAAKEGGLENIELEVFADNIPAIRLYESAGFYREGLKVRGRKWDNRYQDILLMALSL